jgi:hypothetical protein
MYFFKNFILFFVLNVFKPICVFQKFEKLNPFILFFCTYKKVKAFNLKRNKSVPPRPFIKKVFNLILYFKLKESLTSVEENNKMRGGVLVAKK